MAKSNHIFHLQRFFIIFGALISIAALGIIVYASQKPTSTSSHAAAQCTTIPIFYTKNFLVSGPKKINNNLYSYKVTTYINNYCNTPKKWILDVKYLTFFSDRTKKPAWRFLPNGEANAPLAITLNALQKRPLVIDILVPTYNREPNFGDVTFRAELATERKIWYEIFITPYENSVKIYKWNR